MIMRKLGDSHFEVISNLYMDENWMFCGRPYMCLFAHKDGLDMFWDDYTIGITILDNDDWDIGLVYYANKDNFFDVLHELINFMIDYEKGITSYDDICEPMEFFPNYTGCRRERW